MKHLYEIGYGTYEESKYNQYYHKDKLSQEELEDIVQECMCIAIQKRLEDGSENNCQISYQEVMFGYYEKSIFELELEKRGFDTIAPKIEASISLFGWEDCLHPHWCKQTEPKNQDTFGKRILRYINKNIDMSKAICHMPFDTMTYSHCSGEVTGCWGCEYFSQKAYFKHKNIGAFSSTEKVIDNYFRGTWVNWQNKEIDYTSLFEKLQKEISCTKILNFISKKI